MSSILCTDVFVSNSVNLYNRSKLNHPTLYVSCRIYLWINGDSIILLIWTSIRIQVRISPQFGKNTVYVSVEYREWKPYCNILHNWWFQKSNETTVNLKEKVHYLNCRIHVYMYVSLWYWVKIKYNQSS
jgi:hypothetical protein